jgi:hypothetical protein
VKRMVAKIDTKRIKIALEPSAGKGDLIKGYHACTHKPFFDCIEIDENLRHILRGQQYPVIVDLIETLEKAEKLNQNKHVRTKYFDMSFYKKGTLHLVFHSEDLLKKFNLFGAQHKNWLPPSYGKKRYQDMDNEERAVVDSYEGKASYEEMMQDKEFYIVEPGKLLALEA